MYNISVCVCVCPVLLFCCWDQEPHQNALFENRAPQNSTIDHCVRIFKMTRNWRETPFLGTHIPIVLYPISIKSLLLLVILGCIPIKYPHRQTPQLLVTRIKDIPHIWSLNPPHIWSQFGSPRVLRGLSWTRHSEYSESQQVDMANFDSNI